jgi:hypothetical protein
MASVELSYDFIRGFRDADNQRRTFYLFVSPRELADAKPK